MKKFILIAGTAVAAFTASAAQAQYHHHHGCDRWRSGECVTYYDGPRWQTGYRFGPTYSYTEYNTLPQTYVHRYNLTPRYRYVYRDNNIYVVDPTTYAVTRVINALTR